MPDPFAELLTRAECYAKQHNLVVDSLHPLGRGTGGAVWRANDLAIKSFFHAKQYQVEVSCYERLRQRGVEKLGEFHVPTFLD